MAQSSKSVSTIILTTLFAGAAHHGLNALQARLLFYRPQQRMLYIITMRFASSSMQQYQSISEAHDHLCKETLIPFLASEHIPSAPIQAYQLACTLKQCFLKHQPWRSRDRVRLISPPTHIASSHKDTKLLHQLHTLITREREYATTHYTLYHALHGDISLVHDIYRSLLAWEERRPIAHFFPLRFWHTALQVTPDPLAHAHELKLTFENYATNAIRSRPTLLAVNFALYGGHAYRLSGECTIDYWLANKSMTSASIRTQLIEEVFDFYGFDKCYLAELTSAEAGGCLLQIMIPKDKIDKIMYLSQAQGIPFISKELPTPSALLEGLLQGKEEAAAAAQMVQGRIVLARDYALNPDLITIFRERRSQNDTTYTRQEQLVERCMTRVFDEWEQRVRAGKLPSAVIERVKQTPAYRAASLYSA